MEYHSDFTFEISQSLKNNQPNYIRDGNFFDNSTHILSTNQIYEIGQYGPITVVLKKLPPEIF
jgi:hypothetical protein